MRGREGRALGSTGAESVWVGSLNHSLASVLQGHGHEDL